MVSEVLVFSLFSSKITLEDRSKIASWLLTMKVTIHETFKLEKPKFSQVDEKTELVDLVTFFISIVGLGYQWMAVNPDKWEEDMDYRSTRELVKNVKVTNDVAERGVNMDSNSSKC